MMGLPPWDFFPSDWRCRSSFTARDMRFARWVSDVKGMCAARAVTGEAPAVAVDSARLRVVAELALRGDGLRAGVRRSLSCVWVEDAVCPKGEPVARLGDAAEWRRNRPLGRSGVDADIASGELRGGPAVWCARGWLADVSSDSISSNRYDGRRLGPGVLLLAGVVLLTGSMSVDILRGICSR